MSLFYKNQLVSIDIAITSSQNCPAAYSDHAELAQAYVEQVLERTVELIAELSRAERRREEAEAKLREMRRVAA